MGFFSLGQSLKPLGKFCKPLVASGLGKTRIHLGVLVRFALDGGLEIFFRAADWHIGHRIADLFQEIQVTKSMPGFGFRSIAKQAADIGIALDIRHASEVQITAVRLRFSREGILQVLVTL